MGAGTGTAFICPDHRQVPHVVSYKRLGSCDSHLTSSSIKWSPHIYLVGDRTTVILTEVRTNNTYDLSAGSKGAGGGYS